MCDFLCRLSPTCSDDYVFKKTFVFANKTELLYRYFHICWRKQKTEKCHKIVLSLLNFLKTFVISTEMQQIGNKKVIIYIIIYMRITFPFEPLTKIKERVFIFFNLLGAPKFAEQLSSTFLSSH
jgi:hypothetical protein